MDSLSPEARSLLMSKVRSKNTKPEMVVRSLLHRNGFRFRLHAKHLPGSPDIVLPRHHAVIFVNGCFWHGHRKKSCSRARIPKTNTDSWLAKISGNSKRDRRVQMQLKKAGFKILVIWECEMTDAIVLERRVLKFLASEE